MKNYLKSGLIPILLTILPTLIQAQIKVEAENYSDACGLGEIVEHRETGMKSYCGNPNSLADSILELLYNPELCANIVKIIRLTAMIVMEILRLGP